MIDPKLEALRATIVADRRLVIGGGIAAALGVAGTAGEALAANAATVEREADAAMSRLYAANERARELASHSRAILTFPTVTKAGLMVGAMTGQGVLRTRGRTTGFYRISAASYGLQAGAQTFSYALFFITGASLEYLERSNGWSIGSGPSVVVVDDGFARTLNTTTLTQDVYAMIFGQRGLMAGVGLEGAKISRIDLR